MKITRTNDYSKQKLEYSVADAIEASCDGSDYGQGAVEDASQTARNVARALGQLAQIIFDAGLMTPDQLDSMLSYKFKVEE